MKKRSVLSLLLALSILLSLALPVATTAYAEGENKTNSGLEMKKTATPNDDGTYTITLEAYATGEKVISEITQDVPTDIVLVLDQSGSMDDPFSRTTENSWMSYGRQTNSKNYDLRMNSYGEGNLYYKRADGSYVGVSVDRTREIVQDYVAQQNSRNSDLYNANYTLYANTNEGYKKVTITRYGNGVTGRSYTYTYTLNDGTTVSNTSNGNSGNPPYTIYRLQDTYEYSYEYYYTENGVRTTLGTQSKGADTVFDVELFKRVSAGTSITALEALQNAVRNFSSAVETKAAGKDGILGTDDDVNHRIAVVGYASRADSNSPWINTELFIGADQHNYSVDAKDYYNQAFQNMNTAEGQANIQASIGALDANGATYTNYGMEMANGILDAYPLSDKEQRNRVIILFTDGFPGRNSDNFNSDAADTAIDHAKTAKDKKTTVYTVGIFSGANANSAGNKNGNTTEKANWFMQQVSSNNGTPQTPSYYLSAGDSASLSNIFQQISDNIETGGSSTTLTKDTVIKDIISPQFTLPEGTTTDTITLQTYKYKGGDLKDQNSWELNSGDTMGATATITSTNDSHETTKDNQVNVTGFDFSENWCGIEDNSGTKTPHGNKLVISFTVKPRDGFLGGNGVYTNTEAGIYENGTAEDPVDKFERPDVDVTIKEPTVTVPDANVYLGAYFEDTVSADQLKEGTTVSFDDGEITLDLTKPDANWGLEDWQTEYVEITVKVKDKDGNEVTDFKNLTEDTDYTVSVSIQPKTEGTSSGVDKSINGIIHVFTPELTYKDSTAYYGESVPANNDYSANLTTTNWKHVDGDQTRYSTDDGVKMLGSQDAPTLNITYTPDAGKLYDGKYGKQDVPVKAKVSILDVDVTKYTTFLHQNCAGETWTATGGEPAFQVHIKTCQLTITKTGGNENEPYVFDVYKDGEKYTQVTVVGNNSKTIYELPVGTYTIEEDTGWSWRFTADNGTSAVLDSTVPTGEITCTNTLQTNQWLNGFSRVIRNIFGATKQ